MQINFYITGQAPWVDTDYTIFRKINSCSRKRTVREFVYDLCALNFFPSCTCDPRRGEVDSDLLFQFNCVN